MLVFIVVISIFDSYLDLSNAVVVSVVFSVVTVVTVVTSVLFFFLTPLVDDEIV